MPKIWHDCKESIPDLRSYRHLPISPFNPNAMKERHITVLNDRSALDPNGSPIPILPVDDV